MTFQEQIMLAPIPTPEHMLGKGSMMPFNPSNSGGRKLMYGVNLEQRLPLMDPEVPIIGTGFEYQYGQYSSSFIPSDDNYTVIGIISKYSFCAKAHRYYILYNEEKNTLRMVESTSYKHFTENYGLLYNEINLDMKQVGSKIKKGECLLKSRAFDDYNNRMDGSNLLILYNACEKTMEDSIIISESCAKKLASPLIHKIRLVINDNDIPLNLYGTKDNYKVMPDIGEDVSVDNGIVIGYRREKREEMLYSLSYDRLSALSLSDEKITCSGRVVDINVYSNDPSKIEGVYYGQIKHYWNEQLRFYKELVECIQPYLDNGATMDYTLQMMHFNCVGVLSGKQFFNDKVFSNLNVEVTIIEEIPVKTGVA